MEKAAQAELKKQESVEVELEKIQNNLDLINSFYHDIYSNSGSGVVEKRILEESVIYLTDKAKSSEEELRRLILNKTKEILERAKKETKKEDKISLSLSFYICEEVFLKFGTKEEADFILGDLAEWAQDKGYSQIAEACNLYIKGDVTGAVKLFENYEPEGKYFQASKIGAEILEREGDKEGSKKLYSKYADDLTSVPGFTKTDDRYLEVLFKAGRKEEILQILSAGDRLLESSRSNGEVNQVIEFAEKYKTIGETEKANEFYDLANRLLNSKKAYGSFVFEASNLYERIGKPELALKELEGVTAKPLYFYKLRLSKKLGILNADEVKKMEEDIVSDNMSIDLLPKAQHTYFRMGDYDSAFDAMRLYLKTKNAK